MRMAVNHTFDIGVEAYWSKLFFDPEYNRQLYQEALQFKGYEVLDLREEEGGRRFRTLKMEPGFDGPKAVKKILGDHLTYTEFGEFDPQSKRWTYRVTPSVLADKVSIDGVLHVEPESPQQCQRKVEVKIEVRVFGVGSLIESIIEKQTKDSFDKAALFTADYLSKNRGKY